MRLADETWVRALWRVQYRLLFTSCGPEVVLSEEGALRLRAAGRAAAATQCGVIDEKPAWHVLQVDELPLWAA